MTNVDRSDLVKRYEAAGHPFIHYSGSAHLAGPRGARDLEDAQTVQSGCLEEVERQLAAHEAQQRRALADDEYQADRDKFQARLLAPLADDEQESIEARALSAEAARIEARQQGFATRQQLDDLIALQRDILSELRSRR